MTRWFTSDTHFWHTNIIKYCNRPFTDVSHMNEMLVKNWNDAVAPDDKVYHLGDVALGPWAEWNSILTRLNGRKFLVIGNHDRVFAGEKPRMQERFREHYARWFDVGLSDYVTALPFDVDGQTMRVNLSHFPYDGDSHGEDRYEEYRLEDKGVPLIHGHTHDPNQWFTLSKKNTPMFHVGVDAHNYRPVHESLIVNWLRTLR